MIQGDLILDENVLANPNLTVTKGTYLHMITSQTRKFFDNNFFAANEIYDY